MRRLPPCELAGSMRLTEADGTELFAGVRIWVTATEVGIKMNDGNGGPAETLIFTQQRHISTMERFIGLARRNGCIRRFRYLYRYSATQQEAPSVTN